jgi:carbonic anhydrase
MEHAQPLPAFLITRHRERRASMTPEHRARLAELSDLGQAPQAMIIACCDSRVMVSDVFGADAGDFFVHRNIANLVPACTPDNQQHGTSATIEFAVTVLKVRHLIVMGHSGCGGVEGCHDLASGQGGKGPSPDSFVGRWLDILSPSVAPIAALGLRREPALRALEHETVLVSLRNLMTFPFVCDAIAEGHLQLHGLWKDIGEAELEYYDGASRSFHKI